MRGPKTGDDKILRGVVLKVDQFGNLVTNIRPEDVPSIFQAHRPFRMIVGKGEVNSVKQTFAEGTPGEVFAILGSMGFVEIATNRGSAANTVSAGKGTEVAVVFE
jgi:S-adenosylmethionine hydrolase